MQNEIRISAKDLGALAMPDFCPRCFWIKRKVKALPFQIFPGVFMSIDLYTKKVMARIFASGNRPVWMQPAVRQLKAPHWRKFFRTDPETGITLSGTPDDFFECGDKSLIIPDYKTAKFTEKQDELLPLYTAQLNGYAWIEEGFGGVIHSLPLVYCQPMTDDGNVATQSHAGPEMFCMGFSLFTVQIEHTAGMIPRLLRKAREILDMDAPPAGEDGCKDCEKLEELVHHAAYRRG